MGRRSKPKPQVDQPTAEDFLLWGAVNGDIELMQAGTEKGADLYASLEKNQTNNRGETVAFKNETALMIAVKRGDLACMEFLLKHGVNPDHVVEYEATNSKWNRRYSVLSTAAMRQNKEVLSVLLQYGANVNFRVNAKGDTAISQLIDTVDSKALPILEFLIENNGNVNQKNMKGNTPLMILAGYAGQKGVMELMKCLLANGADLSIKNRKGKTALDIANFFEDMECISLIQSYQDQKILGELINNSDNLKSLEF